MSTSVNTIAVPKADILLLDNRFALRRKMSSTALAEVYWADDLYTPTQGEQDHMVLLVLVAPAISSIVGFAKAWSAVMSRPAPPAVSYPNILDWGNEGDTYWFSCANTQGTFLSEYFNEIDKRGLAPDQAFKLTEAVSHALSNVQAGAFGYFEPGATLRTDEGYVLLNAPIVKVMHSLLLQQTGVRSSLALHSPWLSPSVAVGDVPVTEDDSFSMASLYQMFLGLQAPYGQQSTLTALARGTPVTANPKLKTEAQRLLSQALSLQRNQRPENPEALLKGLGKKSYRKLFLPLAALAALGVVVYASSHLITKFNDLIQEPDTQTQLASPPTPAPPASTAEMVFGASDTSKPSSEAVTLVNEPAAKPIESASPTTPTAAPSTTTTTEATTTTTEATNETATTSTAVTATTSNTKPSAIEAAANATSETNTVTPTTATPSTETSSSTSSATAATQVANNAITTEPTDAIDSAQQAQLTVLILKATEAFNAGKLEGSEGALTTLREVWGINRQDPNARALLNKVIAQQQQQTETHINLNKPEEAKTSLAQTDDLIREFTLTDRIEEQVRLESMLEIREREQREVGDLLQQAKTAVKRGDLSKEDSANNAVAYLNKLMFILPNNAEGRALIEEVVQTRQAQIKRSLERNKLSKAASYLDETSRLIRKYNLTDQTRLQSALESDYRQAIEAARAPVQSVETNARNQVTPQPELTLIEQSSPDTAQQAVIQIIPPATTGERYVTPNDAALMNQPTTAEAQVLEQQQVPTAVIQHNAAPTVENTPVVVQPVPAQIVPAARPSQPRPSTVPVVSEPAPIQQIAQPEPIPDQAIQEPTVTVMQPEELPAEIVIENAPTASIETGTVNNQGILDTRAITPPTEQETPDSERK